MEKNDIGIGELKKLLEIFKKMSVEEYNELYERVNNIKMKEGWVCPLCGTVISPYIDVCIHCSIPNGTPSIPYKPTPPTVIYGTGSPNPVTLYGCPTTCKDEGWVNNESDY